MLKENFIDILNHYNNILCLNRNKFDEMTSWSCISIYIFLYGLSGMWLFNDLTCYENLECYCNNNDDSENIMLSELDSESLQTF